jgi:hypothetical protein
MNSNNRTVATLYSLGTSLSREYKYKLHKGDDVVVIIIIIIIIIITTTTTTTTTTTIIQA